MPLKWKKVIVNINTSSLRYKKDNWADILIYEEEDLIEV